MTFSKRFSVMHDIEGYPYDVINNETKETVASYDNEVDAVAKAEALDHALLLTPRVSSANQKRIVLYLSHKDAEKIGRGGRWHARVTDLLTGKVYGVRDASCGLERCRCDAIATEITEDAA